MKSTSIKNLLAFIAIYVIWGSTYLAIRYAVETIPPLIMIAARSLTAGIILLSISRFKNKERIRLENILPLVAIGALFFLIGHGLLAYAQQFVPSGTAAVIIASEPLWVIGIEWFFLRDIRVKTKGIFGLLLGFAGIVYLIASTKGISTANHHFLYAVFILMSAFSWSSGAVYSRVAKVPKSPLLSSGMELVFGGMLVLIASFIIGEPSDFHLSQVSIKSLLGLVYLIIFGSVIAFSAYIWLLRHTSVTRISTHTYVNPIIAVILGWLLAGEKITAALLTATVIIIISVYLVLYDQFREKKRKRYN